MFVTCVCTMHVFVSVHTVFVSSPAMVNGVRIKCVYTDYINRSDRKTLTIF